MEAGGSIMVGSVLGGRPEEGGTVSSLIFLLLTTGPAAETRHAITRCQVSVSLPAGWSGSPESQEYGGICSFGIRPSNWRSIRKRSRLVVNEHAIMVEVRKGTLKTLYDEGRLWRSETGLLCQQGYAGCGEAREVKTECCTLILGDASVRRHWKTGGASGIDMCYTATAVGGGRLAEVNAAPELHDPALFESVVRSLRFR